jgi:hypothetical protein
MVRSWPDQALVDGGRTGCCECLRRMDHARSRRARDRHRGGDHSRSRAVPARRPGATDAKLRRTRAAAVSDREPGLAEPARRRRGTDAADNKFHLPSVTADDGTSTGADEERCRRSPPDGSCTGRLARASSWSRRSVASAGRWPCDDPGAPGGMRRTDHEPASAGCRTGLACRVAVGTPWMPAASQAVPNANTQTASNK